MTDYIQNNNQNIHDVIIVGAGAAGIAAFTKLIKNGIQNVIILEAENRVGGRIHSTFLGEAFVDLGAEEVHGEKGNLIVDIAGDYLKKKKPLTESVCYYSDGSKIDEDISDPIMTLIENFCDDDSEEEKSIGHVFTERFNNIIMKNIKNDNSKTAMAKSFLPLCESFFSILEGPYSWFDVVLESASNYVDCEGDQFIGWKGHGCKAILDILMGKTPKNTKPNSNDETYSDKRILLGKSVAKISWAGKKMVQVKCQDGSTYQAKHIIFTPSVGVLRHKHSEIFKPNLPKQKIEVLQKIGYSNVMKVALQFEKKWWSEAPIALVWDEKYRKENENSWHTSVHWLMDAPDNSKVLVAWLTGPITPSVEQLSDDEIKQGIMDIMNKFLGKYFNVPEPEAIIATRWHSNPNFLGTYSYETLEACQLEIPFQNILAEPLKNEEGKPVVLFAGEATHLTQYSTINGAILSGYREADRILEMYK